MKQLANIISIVLYPMLMPTYAMALLAWAVYNYNSLLMGRYIAMLIGGTMVFTLIIPFSIILLMIRQGILKDAYIADRRQRLLPYLYSIVSDIAWCFFLWHIMKMPTIVVAIAVISVVILIIITVINQWWKISAHLGCMGWLIGSVIAYCLHTANNPIGLLLCLFAAAFILMWARLYLNAHTPAQAMAGFLLGFCLSFPLGLII